MLLLPTLPPQPGLSSSRSQTHQLFLLLLLLIIGIRGGPGSSCPSHLVPVPIKGRVAVGARAFAVGAHPAPFISLAPPGISIALCSAIAAQARMAAFL